MTERVENSIIKDKTISILAENKENFHDGKS